jgi:hypothetical protein
VPAPGEAVRVGDEHRHALEALVAELDHAAADVADEVLVVRLVARGLVAAEALAEVARDHEPAAHQHLERAVDGGRADRRAAHRELALDVLRREVPLGAEHDLGDGHALRGHGEVVIAQVLAEPLDYRAAIVHGAPGPPARAASASGPRRSGSPPSPARSCTPRTTASTVTSGASASSTRSNSQRPRSAPRIVSR